MPCVVVGVQGRREVLPLSFFDNRLSTIYHARNASSIKILTNGKMPPPIPLPSKCAARPSWLHRSMFPFGKSTTFDITIPLRWKRWSFLDVVVLALSVTFTEENPLSPKSASSRRRYPAKKCHPFAISRLMGTFCFDFLPAFWNHPPSVANRFINPCCKEVGP